MPVQDFNNLINNYQTLTFEQKNILKNYYEKIPKLIYETLSTAPKNMDIKLSDGTYVTSADTVTIGDIHGDLKGLLNYLYTAGIINKNGDWAGEKRTVIQLGDCIDRGDYSVETVLYLRMLQEQAEKVGGKVVRLIGNHEEWVIEDSHKYFLLDQKPEYNWLINDNKKLLYTLKNMFLEDIANQNMCVLHGDDSKNIFYVHASVSECTYKEMIKKFYSNFAKDIENLTGDDLYEFARNQKITCEKLSKKYNKSIVNIIITHRELLDQKSVRIFSSFNYRAHNKKTNPLTCQYVEEIDQMFSQSRPICIVGHNIVEKENIEKYRGFIDIDVGTFYGNRAFIVSKNNQYYVLKNEESNKETIKNGENFKNWQVEKLNTIIKQKPIIEQPIIEQPIIEQPIREEEVAFIESESEEFALIGDSKNLDKQLQTIHQDYNNKTNQLNNDLKQQNIQLHEQQNIQLHEQQNIKNQHTTELQQLHQNYQNQLNQNKICIQNKDNEIHQLNNALEKSKQEMIIIKQRNFQLHQQQQKIKEQHNIELQRLKDTHQKNREDNNYDLTQKDKLLLEQKDENRKLNQQLQSIIKSNQSLIWKGVLKSLTFFEWILKKMGVSFNQKNIEPKLQQQITKQPEKNMQHPQQNMQQPEQNMQQPEQNIQQQNMNSQLYME